ncbi:MAG TPA: hypothetical protein VMR17_16225 [Xanthobacteraceae bacterium]|nr:hypothetical protein [Xanthobacteraceae bacterium]
MIAGVGCALRLKHGATRHVGRLTKYNTLTGNTWGVLSPVFTRNHPPGASRTNTGDTMVAKQFALGVAFILVCTGLSRAQTADPQEVLNRLIRQQEIQNQQQFEDRQRERLREQSSPDFSVYGVPAPSEPQAPGAPRRSFGCITFGDGMGGGITDCD